MIKVTNIKAIRLLGVLLILLSGDAFAVRAYATLDGLDTEISNRKSGDSTETARAKVAEGALKTADTAEKAARITGDSTEKTRATKVEGTLNKAIATEVTNRNTAIATEVTARDTAIGSAIGTEVTNRDTAIATEVTNRNTAIATEVTARDTAIGSAIGTEVTNRDTAIATEVANRNTAIATEVTARDTAIVSAIASEVTNRDTAIATETARAKAAEPVVHIVGESYQGGIIFWVDPEGQHGLIAAKADQSSGIQWYNGTYFATNATADGIYAGAKNTEVIISTQTNVGLACSDPGPNPIYPYYCTLDSSTVPASTAPYAALVAANYSIQDDGTSLCTGAATETCYGDWYLPSKFELNLLYEQRNDVGGFANNYYWSSTDSTSYFAWLQYFTNGSQYYSFKNATFRVRAVRAF